MTSPRCTLPIHGLNANYGVFYITRNFQDWRKLGFGPVQLVAASVDHHDAAMAACCYLQAESDTSLAVVIRNRKCGRNVGMIRWFRDSMGYGHSAEFWLRDYGGDYFDA